MLQQVTYAWEPSLMISSLNKLSLTHFTFPPSDQDLSLKALLIRAWVTYSLLESFLSLGSRKDFSWMSCPTSEGSAQIGNCGGHIWVIKTGRRGVISGIYHLTLCIIKIVSTGDHLEMLSQHYPIGYVFSTKIWQAISTKLKISYTK